VRFTFDTFFQFQTSRVASFENIPRQRNLIRLQKYHHLQIRLKLAPVHLFGRQQTNNCTDNFNIRSNLHLVKDHGARLCLLRNTTRRKMKQSIVSCGIAVNSRRALPLTTKQGAVRKKTRFCCHKFSGTICSGMTRKQIGCFSGYHSEGLVQEQKIGRKTMTKSQRPLRARFDKLTQCAGWREFIGGTRTSY